MLHILTKPEVRTAAQSKIHLQQPNDEQKTQRYNATKLLQLNLESDFTGYWKGVMDQYSAKWKRDDLHRRWLSAAEAIISGVSDEWVLRKSLK